MIDCPKFLGTDLPSLLSRNTAGAPDAVIQVIVVDRQDCDLAYFISPEGVAVRPGISDRCDLTLAFVGEDVAALAEGRLDVKRALRTRRLKVIGDESLLVWMSKQLLDPRSRS